MVPCNAALACCTEELAAGTPDTNVLGGKVMHLVDLAAALAALRHARCPVVTASVDYMNFLHPVRVKRLRNLNLPVFLAWCAFALVALVQDMEASAVVKAGIAVTGAYLFVIGGIMQLFPKLGLRGQS